MPNYLYRCPKCSDEYYHYLSYDEYNTPVLCPECTNDSGGVLMSKVLGVTFHRSIFEQSGYNHAVGDYVSGRRDLVDKMKRASEAATIRTGIPHDFKPVDMRDKAETGQTEEGVDGMLAAQVSEGRREVKRRWL